MDISLTHMPRSYVRCQASETVCPLAAQCLRSLALRQEACEGKAQTSVPMVNPLCPQQHYATPECTAYRTATPVRYAQGMHHMFDDVRTAQLGTVRTLVIQCFSCETYFYRSLAGTRLITPGEQAAIAQVFREQGIDGQPHYDTFVFNHVWR